MQYVVDPQLAPVAPTNSHFRAISLIRKIALVLPLFFQFERLRPISLGFEVFLSSRGENKIRFSRRTLCKINPDSKAKSGLYFTKRFFNPNENSDDAAMF
jgi:hypothetical protein